LGGLQPWHWLIVIAVFVLLFGAKKLPDAARSLGKSMRIFKSEIKEMQSDGKPDDDVQSGAAKPAPTPIASERVGGQERSDPGIRHEPAPAPQQPTEQRPA
jgi:sec-independent protein translocase protein TatA